MIIAKQEFSRFKDPKVKKPVYAHQKYVLNSDWNLLKIHAPTSGGKTLSAILFALKEKYENSNKVVRTVLTYPTNLLSKNQFEASVVKGLTEWVGAKEIENFPKGKCFIHPVKKDFIPYDWQDFSEMCGAPTIVFELPAKLGKSKLLVSILSGEILFNMFSEENIIELGEKKGKYLLNVLEKIMHYDHILITSPDLLGYVAQECYSISTGWYRQRWKDELSVKFWEHNVVVDEYHFYDPYTYINLENTFKKLNIEKILLLSATEKSSYFQNAEMVSFDKIEEEFSKDKVDIKIASYPIEVNLVEEDVKVDPFPPLETIYFFNSVITAHEIANDLRENNVRLTEWTGIEKSKDKLNKLIIATSAAEVGLDLRLQEMHTEFWGQDWEIPSLIQRIGRIGRFKSKYPFRAFIYIKDAQEKHLIKNIFDNNETITKDKFTELLYEKYGSIQFDPKDYVSYYLWDEKLKEELKEKWQVINAKINFYFRPPQTQAVFRWGEHKFVYNKFVIENRYDTKLVKKITDAPFWRTFGLSEYEITNKKTMREWKKPYDGKLGTPPTKSKKWFIFTQQNENIDNII
jgi:hypothetical protein